MEAEEHIATEGTEKKNENFEELARENEKKLLNLIVEVMVKITLKEYYETGDQVPEI
jgi:hypothetical protein